MNEIFINRFYLTTIFEDFDKREKFILFWKILNIQDL